MTVTGIGSAKSPDQVEAARSSAPPDRRASPRPAPRCASAAPARAAGVNTSWTTCLTRVWSGGSISSSEPAWIASNGGVRGVRGRPLVGRRQVVDDAAEPPVAEQGVDVAVAGDDPLPPSRAYQAIGASAPQPRVGRVRVLQEVRVGGANRSPVVGHGHGAMLRARRAGAAGEPAVRWAAVANGPPPRSPQRGPAAGRHARDRSGAGRRRRRLGQDPHRRAPHRLPHARARRPCRTRCSRSPSRTRPPASCASASRELIGPPARDLWVATFHAACLRVLRTYGEHVGLTRGFGIYDDGDQLDVLKDVLAQRPRPGGRQPAGAAVGDRPRQVEPVVARGVRGGRRQGLGPRGERPADRARRGGLRPLPGEAAAGERGRLQRHPRPHGRAVRRRARGARRGCSSARSSSTSTSTRTPTPPSTG